MASHSSSSKVTFELTQDADGYPPFASESVWVQRTKDPTIFVVDNIPFFVRDISLEDVIRAEFRDAQLHYIETLRRSGHTTLHCIFLDDGQFKPVTDHLERLGCEWEQSHIKHLIAIDVPPLVSYQDVMKSLQADGLGESFEVAEASMRHGLR